MPLPTSEGEFEKLMEEIDSSLAAQGVSLGFRELAMQRELAIRTGQAQLYPLPNREPAPGVYSGTDLAIRAMRWIQARYGDALLLDFSPGSTVVVLRGAPWLLKLPLLSGTFELVASPTAVSDVVIPGPDVGPPSRVNILDWLEGLSIGIKNSLTPSECASVLKTARIGLEGFGRIGSVFRVPLVREAQNDYAGAAAHLHGQYSHPGQSKWASLQAAEKMLKAFVTWSGSAPRHGHDLAKQASFAATLGLPTIPNDLLAAVQTDASARYGETPVALDEAARAHHAAIAVGGIVAGVISGRPYPGDLCQVDA